MFKVKIKKLSEDAVLPSMSYEGDAGLDLSSIDYIVLKPGDRTLIHTGIALELPPDTEAQVRPRSGYALKNGITVLNSPGTIDQGYRNEIGVILINHGNEDFVIEQGMKVAQLVIKPIYKVVFVESGELGNSDRGIAGYGSSS
jgi:dUTP pyrophosphatase